MMQVCAWWLDEDIALASAVSPTASNLSAECSNITVCSNLVVSVHFICDDDRDCVDNTAVTVVETQDISMSTNDSSLSNDRRVLPVTRESLAKEQVTDVTITECRALANAKRGGYK